MYIIKLFQDKPFCVRCTEGYVIAKRLFGSMGNLLITGSAGFIGSTLAKIALEGGWNIRVEELARERLRLR